ncbi:MAG: 3'-5' exonuclease [Turicibacter sp.]|nr:3'-5' exonuclease [Turicibacter sp.]
MKERIAKECQAIMANGQEYVLLDAEMTGVGIRDEIIELALVDMDGNSVYEGRFCPDTHITDGAYAVHGISEDELWDCPKFSEAWPEIYPLMEGKTLLIYNRQSDIKFLHQTLKKQKIKTPVFKSQCVQELYEKYAGLRRSVTLEKACNDMGMVFEQNHQAKDDCLMTLALVKAMAEKDI